jgi:hypothetical protein
MATDPQDEHLTVGTASNSFIWNPQIMATDQPAAGPPARALDILFVTTTDPNDLGCPFPNSQSIFVCHLPHEVDEEDNVNFLKNGGTCSECGDLGPACFHCIRCDPMGFLLCP